MAKTQKYWPLVLILVFNPDKNNEIKGCHMAAFFFVSKCCIKVKLSYRVPKTLKMFAQSEMTKIPKFFEGVLWTIYKYQYLIIKLKINTALDIEI